MINCTVREQECLRDRAHEQGQNLSTINEAGIHTRIRSLFAHRSFRAANNTNAYLTTQSRLALRGIMGRDDGKGKGKGTRGKGNIKKKEKGGGGGSKGKGGKSGQQGGGLSRKEQKAAERAAQIKVPSCCSFPRYTCKTQLRP